MRVELIDDLLRYYTIVITILLYIFIFRIINFQMMFGQDIEIIVRQIKLPQFQKPHI